MPDRAADDRIQRLVSVELFAECTLTQLRRNAAMSAVIDVAAGRVLCRQGEPGDDFFVIIDGAAVVTIDGTDVATLGGGCAFGEIALLTPNGRRTATVTATTAMTLLLLARHDFAALMDDTPTVARRILQESSRRLAAGSNGQRNIAPFS